MSPRVRAPLHATVPLILAAVISVAACTSGNPDALWQVVHQRCVPDQIEHGSPAPCASVDLSGGEPHGSAVLKDRNGPYQYLLIPTAPISGIENAALYADNAANYFSAAWAARRELEHAIGHPLPRDALSLAINSRFGRSQRQLHIHVDCLKPEIRASLQAWMTAIGEDWAPLPAPLNGHAYQARRVHDADLSHENPFRLLPAAERDRELERSRHTLVLVGAHFADDDEGFVLLDGRATLWPFDPGHGEELQDHACPAAVVSSPS